jgi:hypothetical protein
VVSFFSAFGGPLAVADFNGDGIPDLAGEGIVLLGNGDNTFRFGANIAWGDMHTGQVVVGDFNGDGKPDVAQISDLGVWIFTGNGAGGLDLPVAFMAGSASYFGAVGDFNGDGKADLAVVALGEIAVLTNTTR